MYSPLALKPQHKQWLEKFYRDGLSVGEVAKHFGVSSQAVSQVKNCLAGQQYAATLVHAHRVRINLRAASLLIERLERDGKTMPTELLIKIFAATAAREMPPSVEGVYAEANRLTKKHGLSTEKRDRLIHIGLGAAPDAPLPTGVDLGLDAVDDGVEHDDDDL